MTTALRTARRMIRVGIGLVCLFGAMAPWARAQDDGWRVLNNALVGPQTAYVPLDAELLCARVAHIVPSATGRDALIIYTTVGSARSLASIVHPSQREEERLSGGQSVATGIVLWSEDNQLSTVWRGSASLSAGYNSPSSVYWFAGTRTALVEILNAPGPLRKSPLSDGDLPDGDAKYTLTYMRVNSANGKTQTLLTGENSNTRLLMSPTEPKGILVAEGGKAYRLVTVAGVAPPLAVSGTLPLGPSDTIFWYGWMSDGKTIRGSLAHVGSDGKQARTAVWLDTLTGTFTVESDPKLANARPARGGDASPFIVQSAPEVLTRDGVKTRVYPLWLKGRDASLVGRSLIAADSDAQDIPIVLNNSILYQKAGSIYAVPILKADAREFLARRKEAQKNETMQRAKQLALGLMMYAEDSDENFPPVGSNLKDLVMPYVKNDLIFQNPVNGENGFTPAYTSTSLRSLETPSTTPMGYFAGPDGRAVIFCDGHVRWQDNDAKP